jgi:hypothetical protein
MAFLASAALAASCASDPDRQTLARLHSVPVDVTEVDVADSLERAMQSYRRFLDETPSGAMTPEAMRRLADLQIEQQFGIMGDGEIIELPAPELAAVAGPARVRADGESRGGTLADLGESDEAFDGTVRVRVVRGPRSRAA